MELIIKSYYLFDIARAHEQRAIVDVLRDKAELFFLHKNYSPMVEYLYIELLCNGPHSIIKTSRPKYVEDKQQKYFPRQTDN